jgi:hypothetical protein
MSIHNHHQRETGGMKIQMNYPSRKARSRQELFRRKKMHLIILTNFWLLYFILIGFIPLTNSTFSFFNDTESMSDSISAADNFCSDKNYADNHQEECGSKKHKDNSGIGNGPEPGDDGEGKTDPDNPKHGNDDDHPQPPKTDESKNDKENSSKTENLDTWNQNPDYQPESQDAKNDDSEKSTNSTESKDVNKKVETNNSSYQESEKSPETQNLDTWNQSLNNELDH